MAIRYLLTGIVFWCTLCWHFPAHAKPLRVAVAANFAPTLKQLVTEYQATTDNHIQITSAATGVLYQQIVHGAPFDLFLSADSLRPQLLESDNLTVEHSRLTYARGQLALWSNALDKVNLDSLKQFDGRLAIANPSLAPYGKAARQTLENMSLWQPLQGKLVFGNNVNQTQQQVHTGAVPLGLVALSQVIEQPDNRYALIPHRFYQPLDQQLVILKRSAQPLQAQAFVNFLLSDTSQEMLQQRGYLPVEDANVQ